MAHGQLHESRTPQRMAMVKKNAIDARDNSIKKVIINRSALGFQAFWFLPKSKILLERKVKIIFLDMGNRKIENVNNFNCNFSNTENQKC